MLNNLFLASTNLLANARFNASFSSSGLAIDASEYITSSVILFVIAAELCMMFSSLLQSPPDAVYSASFAFSSSFSSSFFAIFSISSIICSFGSSLNLNTAHLDCIGSIIFDEKLQLSMNLVVFV